MAISNTSILIKRSSTLGKPTSLQAGEIAYSYLSNTLFIGSPAGTGTLNVGGQYYTSTVDSATNANTASTLVKRDVNGAFSGNLQGSSTSSYSLTNAQNFSISGGDITASAQSFNGTGAVTLNASLNSVSGLTPGVYGGVNAIPVVTVAANGRVMSIANTSISSASLTVSGNTGSGSLNGGNTLTIQGGGTGITTIESSAGGSATVTINTDNTVLRSNTSSVGPQIIDTKLTISQDLSVSGNLTVLGTQITLNTASFSVTDPLIMVAANNFYSDILDIGLVGSYNNTANAHTGIFRDPTVKEWFFFDGYTPEADSNNLINIADPSFNKANVYAGYFKGNVAANLASATSLTLTNALTVPNGGTGAATFTNGAIVIGSGTGALRTLANSTFTPTGTSGSNSTITSLTVDAYGRLTAASYTAISGLTVSQGGTGASTFTTSGVIYGNGTGAMQATALAGSGSDQTYTNQILTVTNAGVPVWASALDGGTF